MFVKSKNNYLVTVKVLIGTLMGLENDEDLSITLKEAPMPYLIRLEAAQAEGTEKVIEAFCSFLTDCIVDHDCYNTETEKMTNEQVVGLLNEKPAAMMKVIKEYQKNVLFTQGKKSENE